MKSRGWRLTADGAYGPRSEQVCRAFQSEKGLQADGVIGPSHGGRRGRRRSHDRPRGHRPRRARGQPGMAAPHRRPGTFPTMGGGGGPAAGQRRRRRRPGAHRRRTPRVA
nr:peptidoglycan-binding domain-containing protein [Thermomonospora umbrina]